MIYPPIKKLSNTHYTKQLFQATMGKPDSKKKKKVINLLLGRTLQTDVVIHDSLERV